MHRPSTVYKPKQSNMLVDFDMRGQQGMHFLLWTGIWAKSVPMKKQTYWLA